MGKNVVVMTKRAIFREGVASLMGRAEGISILGKYASIKEFLSTANELLTDVLVMDTDMLDSECLEHLGLIKQLNPDLHIVFLTTSTDPNQVISAMKVGAGGYLSKDISEEDLVKAVTLVADGELVVSCPMVEEMISRFLFWVDKPELYAITEHVLSPREKEVLSLAAKGLRNKEIAEALFVSENTVKAHMRHAMEKLHTHSRQGAVSLLFRKIEFDTQDTGRNSAEVSY